MTTQEIKVANAMSMTIEILKGMMQKGINDAKLIFGISNILNSEFGFSTDQSIIIIEESLKFI